jgi:hypothetical protein
LTFANENILWFGGSSSDDPMTFRSDSGIIIKTSNGGSSFNVERDFPGSVVNIRCFNSDTCLAICNFPGNQNYIWRATNLGSNWQIIDTIAGEHPLTSLISFQTGKSIVTPGFNYIVDSENYGYSWEEMMTQGPYGDVIDQFFPSPKIGYACGWNTSSSYGSIIKTTDSGYSWVLQKTGEFQSICFINDTLGYSVTADGNIFKTSNGGIIDGISPNNKSCDEIFTFPNPSFTELNLKISPRLLLNNHLVLEIYNSAGQNVNKENILYEQIKVECWRNLPSGIYYIYIKYNDDIFYGKEIKME